MKKVFSFIFLLSFSNLLFGQFYPDLKPREGFLGGGMGVTWIDNKPYYSFHLFPEIAFANMGVGLDLKLEMDPSGKLRSENFNEFTDYLSIIRYFRYGYKNDPLYFRAGALDYATLGHGSLMYQYNNSPSYDTRKIGLEFDIDFNTFGFETVYGNFLQAGVFGFRGYLRPLQLSSARDIPILGNLELGVSVVSDFNENAGIIAANYDRTSENLTIQQDDGAITAIGFDVGLPVIRTDLVDLDLYLDYAKFLDFGSGVSTGFILGFNGLGLVDIKARFERRFNNDNYIPSYFNALYEIDRFSIDPTSGDVLTKAQILKNTTSIGDGYYGGLLISIVNTFKIYGSYERLDDFPTSGVLHLSTDVSPAGFPFVLRGGYDKVNLKNEGEIFKLDDRSYLFAEFGYKPLPYIIVSMVYNWTFTPVRDGNDEILRYEPQEKVEPRISFVYPINFGG